MQLKPIIRAIPDITRYKPENLYDVRKHLANFETLKLANKRRKSLVRFLKKYRSNDLDLIKALENCSPKHPCRTLACPRCMRKLRIWLFDQVVPLITEAPRRWFFVTVIFQEHRYQRGELHKFDPKKLIERFRAALRKVGIEHIVAFGGLDYCEETRRQDFNSSPTYTWCVHTHHLVYVSDEKAEELGRILRERFTDSPYVRRPVQFARHKADKYTIFQATSYCVKSVYNGAIVARSPSGQTARKKGRKRLHGKSQAELAALQARQNLGERILLVGLKRNQKSIIRTRMTPTITAAGFKGNSYLNVPIREWEDFSSIF